MIEIIFGTNIVTVFVFVAVFFLFLIVPRRQKGVPSGPFVFPIVGNLPALISRDVLGRFDHLRKKYGDVYGLYIGQDLTIVLNGYEAIHEALVKRSAHFSVRPKSTFHKIIFKNRGIVFSNHNIWKEQRQFAQNALNEFGFNKTGRSMEDRINEEISYFLDELSCFKGPFDVRELLNISVANVIAGILFGKRCDYDDKLFRSCLQAVDEAAKLFAKSSLLINCFPFLIVSPGDPLGLKKIEKIREKPQRFLNKIFKEHQETFDENNIRDVLDLYLRELETNEKAERKNTFTSVQMRSLMGEMLSAGSETTATTILWIILYLVVHPDIQEKLQDDIDEILGKEQKPSLGDREKLPNVEATILECLRISNVAPFAVPHAVHDDVMFRDYLIPRDSTVLVNLNSILKDPKVFPEPNVFRPSRFLTDEGRVTIPKEFIPFSIGRRSCLGESLARMELFLYVTSLLQRFKFQSPVSDPSPKTDGHLGMTYSPFPFRIEVTKR